MKTTPEKIRKIIHDMRYVRGRFLISTCWGELIAAEDVLEELAQELEAAPKEMELPDSDGPWWHAVAGNLSSEFQLVVVEINNYGPSFPRVLQYSIAGDERLKDVFPGRWIKATPPPVRSRHRSLSPQP